MKISIEGLIGCGKSTLLSTLQNETRIPIFLEPINQWTLLEKFYEDSSRWGFTFNIEVLYSMSRWRHNAFDSIYERSPSSCRHVFTQLQYEDGLIDKKELDLFDKLFAEFGWDQDVVIYVKTDPRVCYDRMKKRGRECEDTVPLEYLEKLDKKHDDMLKLIQNDKPHIQVFVVDGNQDAQSVYKEVMRILKDIF